MVRFLKNGVVPVLLLLITVVFVTSCGNSDTKTEGERTIILGHAMNPQHPVSKAIRRMADNVEKYSDGQLKVQIYPNQQLGSERVLLEQLQIGSIGMTKVSAATLENIVPAMQVYSLPYLFRDKEHVLNTWDSEIGERLLKEGERYKLKGLAYYDAGSRSFYTTGRPVTHPEDLKGLKLRVMPAVMSMRMLQAMGGSPTPISYGELYTAFQGGIVDGAENNPPSYFTSKHFEVTNYYSLNEHASIPDVLVIGTEVWSDLSDQEKKWLNRAIDESVAFQRELWKKSVKESLAEVKKAGVEVLTPKKEPFKEAVQPLYEDIERNDPELYKWVERIREIE